MRGFCANVSLLFAELPFLRRFQAARDAGFGCVELHWHREVSPCDVRAAILDAGLEVALINFDGGDLAAGERGILAVLTGSDDVRLQFDAYHMSRVGDDLVGSLRRYGEAIAHVQFADDPGRASPTRA